MLFTISAGSHRPRLSGNSGGGLAAECLSGCVVPNVFSRRAYGTIGRMKPSDSFRVHRQALREMIARHGVTRPRIFGSVAHGEDRDGSDLDLLVEPSSTTTLFTLAALQIEAERLLGVSVDVLTPRGLPRGSRERILKEAVPV